MNTIALPQKIEFKKGKNPNNEIVEIEALFPGYGATIGNSIRRALLSSLDGAAVIGVKIKGASHEFMALPNIKEDILTLILNLKKLRVKLFSDEVVKIELNVSGKRQVTAKDIKKSAEAEVINKDLILATITDKGGSLDMEIYIAAGKGYECVEAREEKNGEVGYIEIDSMFSPVVSVGITIENSRVGKITNWDKLLLDITTDGVITPQEAFNQSIGILIEQFNSLVPKKEVTKKAIKEKEKK